MGEKVLLAGATGRLGRHVRGELESRGLVEHFRKLAAEGAAA